MFELRKIGRFQTERGLMLDKMPADYYNSEPTAKSKLAKMVDGVRKRVFPQVIGWSNQHLQNCQNPPLIQLNSTKNNFKQEGLGLDPVAL